MNASLVSQLQDLEAELHHPGSQCTRERLERLLHPGFHEVGRSGRPYSRATVIAYLVQLRERSSVLATNYKAHALSPDAALLTYESYEPGDDGARHLVTYRSSVWRYGALGWQLFYHQGTPAHA